MSNINLPLSGIADGGLQEKLDIELQKVFNNIHDSNTEAGTKRSITLKLTFKPNETREVVDLITEFKTSLAPIVPIGTTLLTGRNLNTGMVEANELKSQAKGQTYIDFEKEALSSDIGEKITDLRKKRG